MTNWDDIRIFLAAAESGSLSAAASRLGLSVATVGRRLDAIERTLEVKLLHRSSAGATLTAEGNRILAMANDAATSIFELERAAAALKESASLEPVSLSCTETIAADILAPALPALAQRYPELQLALEVANENVSLARRKADLTIRLARPTEENLVVRRLPTISLSLYASKSYLNGRPLGSISLEQEALIGYSLSYRDLPESQWLAERNLSSQIRMRSTSVRALLNAAVAGYGIAVLPDHLANQAGLVQLETRGLPPRQPYLVFHRDMRNVARVKAVRQWVIDTFESTLSQ
ncbi:MAG: LysR family transcriptional regulator [Pseudomonadota bacterium]